MTQSSSRRHLNGSGSAGFVCVLGGGRPGGCRQQPRVGRLLSTMFSTARTTARTSGGVSFSGDSTSSGSRLTWDSNAKYHVMFCPISATNVPKSLMKAGKRLAVTFLGQVGAACWPGVVGSCFLACCTPGRHCANHHPFSCEHAEVLLSPLWQESAPQGLHLNSADCSATWSTPIMTKAEVTLGVVLGTPQPRKERITLVNLDSKKVSIGYEVDLANLCKAEPFQIVMPLDLGNKERTVLTVKIMTLPDGLPGDGGGLYERASTEISFAMEGLSQMCSVGDMQSLAEFKSVLELKSRQVGARAASTREPIPENQAEKAPSTSHASPVTAAQSFDVKKKKDEKGGSSFFGKLFKIYSK